MRKLLLVGVAGLAGCWTSSASPASEPRPALGSTSTGGATYGGRISVLEADSPHDSDYRLNPELDTALHSGSAGAGTGSGAPTGSGYGRGAGARPSGGSAAPPTVTIGDPSGPSQALDPAIIRRYIRRHLPKIQYCYEKELLAAPGLEGRVNVRFAIGGDGRVTQSTGSGMPPVDECVARAIATIEFPKPTGGGVVIVSYPFIFQQPEPVPDPSATP